MRDKTINKLFGDAVILWQIEDIFGMIVPHDSGVKWTNQVGGTACRHPIVEGMYVPLPREWLVENSIENEWGCGPGEGLGEYNRAVAERFLEKNPELRKRFKFDKNFMESAGEAWVPVIVDAPEDEILKAFHGNSAVITYENSD